MNSPSPRSSRRHFLTTAAGASLALSSPRLFAKDKDKPKAKKGDLTEVEHIVVLMMENRSYDHFLGWLPTANGRQGGLSFVDRAGVSHATHALAPDFQGCGHPDPDHSHAGGLAEYNGGKCDGWLRAGDNDEFSIGYYTQDDLAFLGHAAPVWTTFDRYFAATMAETFANRIYQYAAQTDRLENTLDICTLPTIWDRLAAAGVTGRYYFTDVPFVALWGTKYLSLSRPVAQFYADCAAGTLPAVSFVDPGFLGEEVGASNDDHPHADIRNGEVFLNDAYRAIVTSPNWPNTVFVINYDEWGGFFDHVPPVAAPIPPADRAAGNTDGLRGFRVPALAISPWARRAHIPAAMYDHTSILKMIEKRWNLQSLTARDSSANNLADVLDFDHKNLDAPLFDVPPGPFGDLCPEVPAARQSVAPEADKWLGLWQRAGSLGFAVPTP